MLVLRHAGVCVPRQYASFAGIANGGRRCNAFFAKLVRRGYATGSDCLHNRARLYHLHSKRLYYAINEPNRRHRRSVPARATVVRLMLLDAVLTSPDLSWLATESKKADLLTALTASAPENTSPAAPGGATSGSVRELPGTFPIGTGGCEWPSRPAVPGDCPLDGGVSDVPPRHATLLRMARAWMLRLVFPRPLDRAYDAYQAVIREELETPLHRATINELKWYFAHRQQASQGPVHPQTQGFLDVGARIFGTPRFTLLYRRWLKHGDAVFESISSPVIAEALATGTGRVECVILPHSYRHLSPLVDEAPAPPQQVRKGLRRGNREGNRPPHALNPRPHLPLRTSGREPRVDRPRPSAGDEQEQGAEKHGPVSPGFMSREPEPLFRQHGPCGRHERHSHDDQQRNGG